MMEVEAPLQASQPLRSRTPESLRQRQRDRLSPRGRSAKGIRGGAAMGREGDLSSTRKGFALAPTSRCVLTGSRSPEMMKKRRQDGLRKEDHAERRAKREAEDAKLEVTPDGGSAGREGRQFTVANVGLNGRIYLRPTIRPANQRYPQPSFVFPSTPPSTAGLDAMISRRVEEETQRDSLWTPARSPSTLTPHPREHYFAQAGTPTQPPRHRRALSHSTVDEHSGIQGSDLGAFKVVIERPGARPRTTEGINGIPTLEVPIPSYRLGTPRFSTRGTAMLRGTSYTTTEDVRSSTVSRRDQSQRNQSFQRPPRILSRRHSDASPQPHYPAMPSPGPFDSGAPSPGVSIHPPTTITPEMFDALTFKPACDHPAVVRYSTSGMIRAATPARLVAEITSPTFVDYDLLSDFFLTFRSFLETSDLLYMLIARLKWALARDDEVGTVVRVRTFVALRHWILNYFADDFIIDYDLRVSFCDLLNNFMADLPQDPARTKVPLKILVEIKKCWRRVGALYWDGPDFDVDLGPNVPIRPGGVAGSRNPDLDDSFWEPAGPPRLEGIIEPDFVKADTSSIDNRNYFADVSRAGHLDSMIAPQTITIPPAANHHNEPPISPTSIMSEDFVSCSFPSRGKNLGAAHPIPAHPVPASSVYDAPPVATTPKALTGKRVRPAYAHKRSGSFSDSFRDRRPQQQPIQKVIYKNTEILLALPFAGSLVRGNLFPPSQPFVEVLAPSTPAEAVQSFSLFPGTTPNQKGPSAMSGPGMKKLLGSVRRALSARPNPSANSSPTQGSFPHIPPLGVRGATINRLPGTAIVPQAREAGAKAPMRIDLLGAEIAEDFKRAVKEDAEAESERRRAEGSEQDSVRSTVRDENIHYSEMRPETTFDASMPVMRKGPTSEITMGSKSIVIVDDTFPFDLPMMTGALPNHSVDTFADAYMHPSGGPTPPSTPPEAPLGTPRRSSHLLGAHTRRHSLSFDRMQSMIADPRPSGDLGSSPSRLNVERPSLLLRAQSHRSKKSISLRRYASYQSGFTRHVSERSFDASTFSEPASQQHLSDGPSVPLPLRVLRRRPGGDLRAVTNVGDLPTHPLRRPMSTGSLTTYSDSIRSSYLPSDRGEPSGFVEVVNSDYDQSQAMPNTFSLGALAASSAKPHVSLFSTHSSQPVMRPSFEKEAQMLAQIPDDEDDDGGVESALLKLEGKFEQRRSDMSTSKILGDTAAYHGSFGAAPVDLRTTSIDQEGEKRKHRQEHVMENGLLHAHAVGFQDIPPPQVQDDVEELVSPLSQPELQQDFLVSTRSMDSYNSIPLLERGLTDDERSQARPQDWTHTSILRGPSAERHPANVLTPESSHASSFDFIQETGSMRRIRPGETKPSAKSTNSRDESFLDSDSDDRSDLSSELSVEVISRTEYTEHDSTSTQTFPPTGPGTVTKDIVLPSHPLRHPPSPRVPLVQSSQLSPNLVSDPQMYDQPPQHQAKNLPPSPETTPTTAHPAGGFNPTRGLASPSVDPLRSHRIPEASRKTSVHLPFILAFDSQILAQQFTLIEKDALNEIDWKDLIEMRWKNASTESHSWVEFLRTSEPRGVEVVIARFNIMVKWAVSECVLTQDMNERVRCIVKYIHIAAYCRKIRNFATMTQLTIALASKDVSRLTKTWAQVPAAEMRILRDLEALVTPTLNFHAIRAEMEGAGADQGCIPFVGIYTHDLLVNAERPSQFASTPTTEPLVNFERCRTDAAIVKNLLRLLEASQLYRYLPIEGITERCLWMAALSDAEIARYGVLIQA